MAVVGIDLGTTNSLVAYWDETEKEAKIIPNALGEHLTPSVVSVDENGEVLLGRVAKENYDNIKHLIEKILTGKIGLTPRQ